MIGRLLRWVVRRLAPRDARPEAAAAAREALAAKASAEQAKQGAEATKRLDPEVDSLAAQVRRLADRDVFAQMLAATFGDRRHK